jgi:hypothetical protein
MPKSAKCRTAQNAELRKMPNGANRNDVVGRRWRAVWHFAPFGISRRLAFRAVWHFA